MASWTSIPNSSLETGAPARSADALAFRDNPIAIAEGAVGAPRIANAAFNDLTIGGEKLQTYTIRAEKLQAGADESNWVSSMYAGVSANEIGSVCISATFTAPNGTIAGSSLVYVSGYNSFTENWIYTSLGFSGTWRSLGGATSYNNFGAVNASSSQSCLYVRIA